MFRRSVHQTMWLAQKFSNFLGKQIIVVVNDKVDRNFVQWMTEQGDVMVITAGGSGVPKWFQPHHMILDESFNFQNYSDRIWFDAVIRSQMVGTDCLLHSWDIGR